MKKLCVFCGEKPRSKNKEHVLPKWLIAHTGPPNRVVRLGFDKITGKPREFSYNSFAFPACESCNTRFGELESLAKEIILKLLSSAPLSKIDLHYLLDWFDKVRIGLWLAFHFLDKNLGGIKPKFHISSRIGLRDRMLIIIRVDNNENELTFRGCDMPSFYYNPSCFSMNINNYCFINISSPFLFSRRIGFPYPTKSFLRADGSMDFELENGRERVMKPLIRKMFKFKGTSIYQPMFRWLSQIPAYRRYYETEYVQKNSLSGENGIGEVFFEKDSAFSVYPFGESDAWIPSISYERDSMNPVISIHTIQLQLFIDTLSPSRERLPEEQQIWWKKAFQTNSSYGNRIIKLLKTNADET